MAARLAGTLLESWKPANPEEIRRLSVGARRFAQEKLGLDRFEGLVHKTVRLLGAGERSDRSQGESDLPYCLQRGA